MAANVDVVVVTWALDTRVGNSRLKDMLALARDSGATPVLVLSKVDAGDSAKVLLDDLGDEVDGDRGGDHQHRHGRGPGPPARAHRRTHRGAARGVRGREVDADERPARGRRHGDGRGGAHGRGPPHHHPPGAAGRCPAAVRSSTRPGSGPPRRGRTTRRRSPRRPSRTSTSWPRSAGSPTAPTTAHRGAPWAWRWPAGPSRRRGWPLTGRYVAGQAGRTGAREPPPDRDVGTGTVDTDRDPFRAAPVGVGFGIWVRRWTPPTAVSWTHEPWLSIRPR